MNEHDRNNLRYIMGLDDYEFDTWSMELSNDDISYAIEIIQQARLDLIEQEEKLLDEVDASQAQVLKQMAALIDVDHNFPAAVGQVRALMFIEKFSQEVQHQLDACS